MFAYVFLAVPRCPLIHLVALFVFPFIFFNLSLSLLFLIISTSHFFFVFGFCWFNTNLHIQFFLFHCFTFLRNDFPCLLFSAYVFFLMEYLSVLRKIFYCSAMINNFFVLMMICVKEGERKKVPSRARMLVTITNNIIFLIVMIVMIVSLTDKIFGINSVWSLRFYFLFLIYCFFFRIGRTMMIRSTALYLMYLTMMICLDLASLSSFTLSPMNTRAHTLTLT